MRCVRVFPLLRRSPRVALLLTAALGSPACTGPDPIQPDAGPGGGGCQLEFIGDPAEEVELELTALDADSMSRPIADGDDIALIFPPQGGRVVFAGVRVRNIDPCAVRVAGALRDPATLQVRFDARTVNLRADGSGWGGSVDADISTFANIPACPNQWASTDLYGRAFELTVSVTDRMDRKTERTIVVVPRCSEPDREKECLCMCSQGYVLGQACP